MRLLFVLLLCMHLVKPRQTWCSNSSEVNIVVQVWYVYLEISEELDFSNATTCASDLGFKAWMAKC
jgi:hypothetical protein